MKPVRLFMSLNHDGTPRYSPRGFLPLERDAESARYGWGAGFFHPRVIEVEVRPVAAARRRKRAR